MRKKKVRDQAESLRQLIAQEKTTVLEKELHTSSPSAAIASPLHTEPERVNENMGMEAVPSLFLSPDPEKSTPSRLKEDVPLEPIPAHPKIPLIPKADVSVPPMESTLMQSNTADLIFTSKRLTGEKETRVIAVTGGKGGVGKSNIACNLGLAFCRLGRRVMLLDADLSLANVDVLLGLTPRLNLSQVISGEKNLEDILLHGPEGLTIVPGGSGLEELAHLPPPQMERLFNAFASHSPAPDILLVDTAAGIHANVMQFLLSADQVIVVTTPEPTAYTDAYALIKILVKHNSAKEIGVLINMAQDSGEALEVTKLLLQICRQMLKVSFNNLGYIPRDPMVLKSVCHQRPFLLYAPNAPASKSIYHIAASILQIDSKNGRSRSLRGFFQKLFRTNPNPLAAESH